VVIARNRQVARQGKLNSALIGDALDEHCRLNDAGRALLVQAAEQLAFSARAYHRVLRVARTIADLADSEVVQNHHLAEAISMRPKLRAGSTI
jgi:magnesium chelatase family protein